MSKKMLHLRDRIVEFKRIPAHALRDNALNWRTHPQQQRDALAGVLKEIGIAGALLVYESERHGGLTIIDGHLRKADFGEQDWPCIVTDLTDEEADLLLTVHDPLAAMAKTDKEALEQLMAQIATGDAAIQSLLGSLADQEHLRFTAELPLMTDGLPPGATISDSLDSDEEYVPSHVRMVQLFLTTETFPQFKEWVGALRDDYGTETETDTVMECLRRAYDSLDI